ncbi:unnamed protein product [Didymodactylos carnosus]|uniref:Tetratricopeptide repeat protein n=1 Tax=Didymodactylos carnosus TaxID=1234261 RepID=A0A815F7Q7_9BILA|nr:unnamed protein product [Didymodactylos carnosus]CAF1321377.1 unnamed protein product [Didymodactylos carnosus]CAF3864493.1 unnamed protein product [Didymodactylos carnosus]CAF4167527.1 unnamed protein product [Didymodactylos carnosus]
MALTVHGKISQPLDPNFSRIYNNIGTVYFETNSFLKAIEYLDKAHQIEEKFWRNDLELANTYYYLGKAYYMNCSYKEALENIHKELEIKLKHQTRTDPIFLNTYCYLQKVYYKLGNESAVMTYGEAALKVDVSSNHADFFEVYFLIGLVYSEQLDYKNALRSFEKALEIGIANKLPEVDKLRETVEYTKYLLFLTDYTK